MSAPRLSTKVLVFLYQVLFFLTPLVFCFATHELFEFPKMIFVYILTAGIVIAFVLQQPQGDWGGLGREGKRLAKLVGLLFLVYLLTTIFSQHLYTSLFGYYTRFNGGLLSLMCYLTLAVIFWAGFGGQVEQVKGFLKILLASSFLVSGYAIAQHFGWDKELWVQNSQARVFSTLGQPNWLAAWAAVVFPINLALLLEAKVKMVKREEKLYFILGLLNFAAAWFTYSLSGLLGLAVATLTFLYLSPKETLKGNRGILGRLFLVMAVIVILQPGIFGDRVIWTWRNLRQKIAMSVTALAQTTDQAFEVKGSTVNIRLEVWQGSLDLIRNHWLLGTGPETFAYAFLPYRPASLNYTTEWDFLYNKAHNEYLNLAAGIGVPGLVIYLLLLPTVLWLSLKSIKEEKEMAGKGLVIAGLTAGWVSLWVTNFFGFSVVTTSLLFWLIHATILSLTIQLSNHPAIQPFNHSSSILDQRLFKVATTVGALWLLFISGKIFLADIYYTQGLTQEKQNLPVSAAFDVQ
ncbi:MAG: O-antigen ligase family protein, partial [bacterium]|nr:O-antigen ligase family protein [bacterium]